MANFLLWNICKKDLGTHIARLAIHLKIDVFIFIEPPPLKANVDLEAAVNRGAAQPYRPVVAAGCTHVHVSSRLPPRSLVASMADTRYAIYRLTLGQSPQLLIAAAHLLPKYPQPSSPENQCSFAEGFSKFIQRAERKHKHTRTIVAGDLNMNPSDLGMISADGLHAVPSRTVAEWPDRNVNGVRTGPLFFNPAFSLWGDVTKRPPGTTYFDSKIPDCIFWSVFDQVLYRHAVTAIFDHDSLKVMDSDGVQSLCKPTGEPIRAISDHLPVFFRLKI